MNIYNVPGIIENPVIPGFYSDPSICRDGEDYYAVFSSFEFFPGVPVFHSKDLVNWKQIAFCLTESTQLSLDNATTSDGIYAPTLRRWNNRFYMITSNRCSKSGNHFYVTADTMAGPFGDPVWITDIAGNPIDGVDPSLFFDEDGQVYFSCVAWDEKGQGIGQAKIDLKSGALTEPLEIVWHGTGGTFPEGPHTYHMNGWYYLMIAEGGTEYGHKVSIARSRNIQGPYESCPHNPILTQNYQYVQSNCLQGVGHGDLFEALDHTWWLMVHGFRTSIGKLHHLGRETMLAPVEWDKNGWPVVNRKGWLDKTIAMKGMFSKTLQKNIPGFKDDFSAPAPNLRWNYLRNPDLTKYRFSAVNGKSLSLIGSSCSLNDEGSPTWLGTRQRHFTCRVLTEMKFSPRSGDEAGFTVFQTAEHHYDVVVTSADRERICYLRKTVGDIVWTGDPVPLSADRFSIIMEADRAMYSFTVSCDGKDFLLGKGRTQLLSTEAMQYQNFTGTFLGMYAVSVNTEPVPAEFMYFEYSAAE